MLLTITVVGTSQLQVAQPLQTTSPSCLQVSKITSVAVGKITSLSWFSSPTTRPMTTTIPIGEDPLKTSMFTWPKWVILLVALISTYPYLIKIYSLQICKRLQECSSEYPSIYLGLLGPMACIRKTASSKIHPRQREWQNFNRQVREISYLYMQTPFTLQNKKINLSSWRFQPISNILVRCDHFPK